MSDESKKPPNPNLENEEEVRTIKISDGRPKLSDVDAYSRRFSQETLVNIKKLMNESHEPMKSISLAVAKSNIQDSLKLASSIQRNMFLDTSFQNSLTAIEAANRSLYSWAKPPNYLDSISKVQNSFLMDLKTKSFLDSASLIAKANENLYSTLKVPNYLDAVSEVANSHKLFMQSLASTALSASVVPKLDFLSETTKVSPIFNNNLSSSFNYSVAFNDLWKQAVKPPLNVNLLSTTVKEVFEATTVASSLDTSVESKLYSNLLESLHEKSEINWEPILELSAKTSGLAALHHLPEEKDSSTAEKTLSLEEIRESAFRSIGELGSYPPEQMQHAFRFLWSVETEIRRFIHNVMTTAFGKDWEKTQLPRETYNDWVEKKQKALKRKVCAPNIALIEFADFTDYEEIIVAKKNWKLFEPFFNNKTLTQASFQRLFPYRISTMHGRVFAKSELIIIAGDCEWLLKCLGSSLADDSGKDT
jgi:hypothetical protein